MSFTAGPFTAGPFQAGPFRTGPLDMYGVLWDFAGSQPPTAAYNFRRTGLGTLIDASGNVVYGDHNLLLNSATLSTQNVTTVAQQYTLKFSGSGTVTLSGTGSGVLSAGTNTFTATAGTLTLTVSGAVTAAQLNAGASATAYVETAGAAVYLPRYTFNHTTHAALGLLIEPQVTTTATTTADFSGWTAVVVSTSVVAGPGGVFSNATNVVETSNGASALLVAFGKTVTSGAVTTLTFWVKKQDRQYLFLRCNDNATNANAASVIVDLTNTTVAAAATAYGTFSGASATVDLIGDGHVVSLVFTSSTASVAVKVAGTSVTTRNASGELSSSDSVNGTANIQLRAWQLEAGSVATSYIPNPTSGSLVRTTDGNWDITGSDFTQLWGGGSERTIVVEWYDTGSSANGDVLIAYAAGSNEMGIIYASAVPYFWVRASGVISAYVPIPGSFISGGRNKVAFSFVGSSLVLSMNGGSTGTYTITVPVVDTIRIAGSGLISSTFFLTLKSLSSRPTAITGAALQALSAL